MPDVALSDARKKRFDFNRLTVLSSWLQIYCRKDISIKSYTDLNDKTIAILKGSIQSQTCREIREKLGLHFLILEQNDYEGTVLAVESGKADAVIVGRHYAYRKRAGKLKPTALFLSPTTLHFASAKDRNRDLLLAIDKHLSVILNNSDSVYYKSLAAWFHDKPRYFLPQTIIWVIIIFIVCLILLILISLILKYQVNIKTRDLKQKNQELQKVFKEMKESEKVIKKSLMEKEILLQELYHRTKNNMSVISSLLSLKSKKIKNSTVVEFAKDIKNKILSMAAVHKMLYKSLDLSSIDVKNYINELIKTTLDFYPHLQKKILFDIYVDHLNILIDTAVPFGLVLNELLTNSFKHAFPDKRKGIITIILHSIDSDNFYFLFSDNGIGLKDNFKSNDNEKLGIKMIYDIVEIQMQGSVNFKTWDGTKCVIEFPAKLYTRRV